MKKYRAELFSAIDHRHIETVSFKSMGGAYQLKRKAKEMFGINSSSRFVWASGSGRTDCFKSDTLIMMVVLED